MDNLEETEKFLEMYSLPRLNQEERENMNWRITSMKLVESIIPKLPTKKKKKPMTRWLTI